ncbi:hypothetical protein, partial [Streptomyces sp. NPDC059957]|uniref:hypothetical protein n=1 Tax=Streptomyces sp. NPDC059957 TaxID=3347016 RepID=UPI0036463BAC
MLEHLFREDGRVHEVQVVVDADQVAVPLLVEQEAEAVPLERTPVAVGGGGKKRREGKGGKKERRGPSPCRS